MYNHFLDINTADKPRPQGRPTKTFFYLLVFILPFLLLHCAQPISPTGGKKDTTPPKLIKSTPTHKQTNFQGKTVELEFDEYIVLDNLQQKLLITPDAGEYDFKARPTSLRIIFKKQLDSAKTYSLSFGDAVKDFAEKNPAQNLRLVFSTGPGIDSASVGGTISDLLTDQMLFDVVVGLYPPSDTLNIEKIKPSYFTRSDSSGRFSIENVQPNRYRLIAFDDRNRSLTYNLKAERIAYFGEYIVLNDSTKISDVSLKLFLANNTPPKVRNTQPGAFFYSVFYDKGITDYKVKFATPEDSLPYFRAGVSELKFFNPKNRKDTIVASIMVQDSMGVSFEHTQKIKFREPRPNAKGPDSQREAFQMTPNFSDGSEVEPRLFDFLLTFNKPVAEARLSQIQIFSDSLLTEKIAPDEFVWENNRSILKLTKPIRAKTELKVVLPKDTFFSIENDTIPAKTFKMPIMDEEDYGSLEGEIRGLKADEKYIIELLNEKYEVIKSIKNQSKFQFTFLKPMTYYVRLILDKNANGRWDTGNFKANKPAEPVIFYKEAVKIKKNFVISGIDFDLSTQSTPKE
ncbi:MAG: Ig-like domain-containing domain [Runella sp.]